MNNGATITDKRYERDDIKLFKNMIITVIVALASFWMANSGYVHLDNSNNIGQLRYAQRLFFGGLGTLLFGAAAIVFVKDSMSGTPVLKLTQRGLQIQTAFRKTDAKWNEITTFSFINKFTISANFLAQPTKKLIIPALLKIDKKELCGELNRHVATAQGLNISEVQAKTAENISDFELQNQHSVACAKIIRNRKIVQSGYSRDCYLFRIHYPQRYVYERHGTADVLRQSKRHDNIARVCGNIFRHMLVHQQNIFDAAQRCCQK